MNNSVGNQALIAAAPILDTVLAEVDTFVTTTLNGDPAQIALRADGAFKVLTGQIELQFPALATAEVGAVATDITSGISALRARIKAAAAAAAASQATTA